MRAVVWIPGADPGWTLPPAVPTDWGWLGGGRRTMHELAVALACAGEAVELRGEVDVATLHELSDAAGARPGLPDRPREPEASDVVFVYEGIEEPIAYTRLALSPARAVLMVLAAPGLFGWPFTAGWTVPDPLTVEPESVARPEYFETATALGFELWSNSRALQRAAESAGTRCRFVGRGIPVAFPQPAAERDIDALVLENNRWAPLAARVAEELGPRAVVAPHGRNRDLLELLGRARVLVHPMRVEGNSRITCEARGVVAVGSVGEMAGAVERLLADPDQLGRLSARGMESAREEVAWEPFVERVAEALADAGEDVARPARAELGAALREAERRRVAGVEHELDRHRSWLTSVNESLSWRMTSPLRAAGRRVRRR